MNKNLQPVSSEDDAIFFNNPDRGFRLEIWMDVEEISKLPSYEAMKKETFYMIEDKLMRADFESITLAQSYMNLSKFIRKELSDKALLAIQAYIDSLNSLNLKALLRFVYLLERPANQRDVPKYDATEEIKLIHIEQLKPIVHKNKDSIHALQAGFIGIWGEWHGYHPDDEPNRKLILNRILNVLTPSSMYVHIRLPRYKKDLLSPTDPSYKRVGFNNDAFFGKTMEFQSEDFYPNTYQWQMVVEESPYTPQDGELFWYNDSVSRNFPFAEGYASLEQFSEHRYTSFSILHNFADTSNRSLTAMGMWRELPLTEAKLKNLGIIYTPSWFKDSKGNKVSRNVFDFVRDHLGYKLEAQSVKISGETKAGATVTIEMPLVNYGFSAAFNMQSGFAILDKNNKLVTSVNAGNPSTWYSRSPTNYNDSKVLIHKVKANIKLPSSSGDYKVAFYVKNNRNNFARIGNKLEYVNGYHVLHQFSL